MNQEFATYQTLALRTAAPMDATDDLMHAALGLSGEAGEFADCIKKNWVYGQPLDKANAIEELGDLLWYIALACNALDVQLADVASMNIEKLRKRYPNRYQHDLAAFRADKQMEIQGLEAQHSLHLPPDLSWRQQRTPTPPNHGQAGGQPSHTKARQNPANAQPAAPSKKPAALRSGLHGG